MDFPPGFRFSPTEEELVSFYLHHKLEGGSDQLNQIMDRIIPVLDIYHYNPWDLPQASGDLHGIRDQEQWFFFVPRQESEARGGRPKRLTNIGYWKATGSPGHVYSNNRVIGMKRTMVFYWGRAPNGSKTEWKMNEYKAVDQGHHASSSSSSVNHKLRDEFSLCRVYKKSKCLRAFDRRPVGAEVGEAAAAAQPACGTNNNEATVSYQNQLQMVDRAISSLESSTSGDQGNPSQPGPSSNKPISTDNDSLWDWDSIDPEEDMMNLQLD